MLRSSGIEGWAERRETFGCQRAPVGHLASKTRVNALMTRHTRRLRGALRPMTRQYAGRNNVTISMADDGSVPIVSQTEIEPIKTALSPHGYIASRLILHAVAGRAGGHRKAEQRRHLPVGMDCVGLVLLAKWPRATLAFAPASFSLSRVQSPCRAAAVSTAGPVAPLSLGLR